MVLSCGCRAIAAGVCLSALATHSPFVLASTSAYAYASVNQTLPSTPVPAADTHTQSNNGPGLAPSQANAAVATGGPSAEAMASASASASAGRLSVFAASGVTLKTGHYDSQGNAYLNVEGPNGTSEARASFYDQLTFVDASRTGQMGVATAWINLSGSVSASNPGFLPYVQSPTGAFSFMDGTGTAAVLVNGTGLNWTTQTWDDACAANGMAGWLACTRSAAYDPSRTTSYSAGAVVNLPVSFNFVFGTPLTLGYSLVASSDARGTGSYYKSAISGQATAVADMSHTLAWGGIVSVTDSNGLVIPAYGLSSDSGLDYRVAAAVPEPQTWMLLLAGMGVVGAAMRRRRLAVPATGG